MPYNKILIAVDSSEYSMKAARKGLDLAHQIYAEVALLYVVDMGKAIGNPDANITNEQALIVVKKEVEETLDNIVKLYNGGKMMRFMPEGHPMEDIIKTAETWGADLIVMGTHGRTGLKHLLMGSVAESVVRHTTIPVMVVPSKP